jgi:hypothetical protein
MNTRLHTHTRVNCEIGKAKKMDEKIVKKKNKESSLLVTSGAKGNARRTARMAALASGRKEEKRE